MTNNGYSIIVKNIFPTDEDPRVIALAKKTNGFLLKICEPNRQKFFRRDTNFQELFVSAVAKEDHCIRNCSLTFKLLMKENTTINNWPFTLSMIRHQSKNPIAWKLEFPKPSSPYIPPQKIYIKIGKNQFTNRKSNIIRNNLRRIENGHIHGSIDGISFTNIKKNNTVPIRINGLGSMNVRATVGLTNITTCSFAVKLIMNTNEFKYYTFGLSIDTSNKQWILQNNTDKEVISAADPKNININVGDDNQPA